jgi:NADH dehydrogenase FAD-containing subunit
MNGQIKHVVVVSGGFGGLRIVRNLADAPVRVTLLNRWNYHLFQPLLYQVATAGLGPTDIAHSLRAILKTQRNVDIRLTEVTKVDLAGKTVTTDSGALAYDYLVLAVGGGPTGVECAGALSELFRLVLIRDYLQLNIKDVRIVLLEGEGQTAYPMIAPVAIQQAEWASANICRHLSAEPLKPFL